MCEMLNVDDGDIVHAVLTAAVLRPAHAVVLDRSADAVVLCIRGSLNAEDILTGKNNPCERRRRTAVEVPIGTGLRPGHPRVLRGAAASGVRF